MYCHNIVKKKSKSNEEVIFFLCSTNLSFKFFKVLYLSKICDSCLRKHQALTFVQLDASPSNPGSHLQTALQFSTWHLAFCAHEWPAQGFTPKTDNSRFDIPSGFPLDNALTLKMSSPDISEAFLARRRRWPETLKPSKGLDKSLQREYSFKYSASETIKNLKLHHYVFSSTFIG